MKRKTQKPRVGLFVDGQNLSLHNCNLRVNFDALLKFASRYGRVVISSVYVGCKEKLLIIGRWKRGEMSGVPLKMKL